jgi:nicotinamidase/pyrazinamidase
MENIMNVRFLIIDPQNDFANPQGSLFVPNADKDSERFAAMLERHLSEIKGIHVTLDTHRWVDIAHPIFWVDNAGNHPAPFTVITEESVLNGQWKTIRPDYQIRATKYVESLKINGRYDLVIWPPHCLLGQWGNNVVDSIAKQLNAWENNFQVVDYVIKGINMWTEHYSAVKADVPDVHDSSTQLNMNLIKDLESADLIICSGQALSHCVANTIRDIADNFNTANIQKLVLIEDTTSPVPGFESLGEEFLAEMKARGMRTAHSTDFLV